MVVAEYTAILTCRCTAPVLCLALSFHQQQTAKGESPCCEETYERSSRVRAVMPPTFLWRSLRSQAVFLNFVSRLIPVWAWRKVHILLYHVSTRMKGGGDSSLAHDDVNFCVRLTGKRTGSLKTFQALEFVCIERW